MLDGLRRAGAPMRRRHAAVRSQPDRGYSVLEAAITLPAMIFLLMFIVQWAILWHARSVAEAAAQEGLRSASGYQSSAATGQRDAENFLHQTAPRALPDAKVSVDRGPTIVTVKVHSSVMSVIPFGDFSVDESAAGPVETYVAAP
jgi:Flp pilus assembly protein TadG